MRTALEQSSIPSSSRSQTLMPGRLTESVAMSVENTRLLRSFLFSAALAALCFLSIGCSQGEDSLNSGTVAQSDPAGNHDHDHDHDEEHAHDHDDPHAHPTEGPHGGELIELGDHDFHAELLHPHGPDDSQEVVIYVLDQSAKQLHTTDSESVSVNVTGPAGPASYQLDAVPETDVESSEFRSSDGALIQALQSAENKAVFVITINGKSYRGNLSH